MVLQWLVTHVIPKKVSWFTNSTKELKNLDAIKTNCTVNNRWQWFNYVYSVILKEYSLCSKSFKLPSICRVCIIFV